MSAFKLVIPMEIWADVLFFGVGPPAQEKAMAEHGRRELRDRRKIVVQVCRGWKKAAWKYLFIDPYLPTPQSLHQFTSILVSADKKWDDLRHSPHSLPGAYVRTLDLSHLCYEAKPVSASSSSSVSRLADIVHRPWMQSQLLCQLIPLVPSVETLVLPSGEGGLMLSRGIFLRALKESELSSNLKRLKGLGMLMNGVIDGRGVDPLVSLLEGLPALEELSVVGGGGVDMPPSDEFIENNPQPMLYLKNLQHLSLIGIRSSLLLQALIDSDLPELTSLHLTSYHSTEWDLTTPLLQKHGWKLKSLTFIHLPDFPQPALPFPENTLLICPSLESLQFETFPHNTPPSLSFFDPIPPPVPAETSVRPAPPPPPSKLRHVILPRPPNSKPATEGYKRLMSDLSHPSVLPSLSSLTFTKFNWVHSPNGGSGGASSAGTNGIIREWAIMLGKRGVVVLDGKNKPCPDLAEVGGKWLLAELVKRRTVSALVGRERRRRSVRSWDDSEQSEDGG
ncbi:hypothetical protein [Phaffia rhodozyma]|uniref:F-box domain-containing protein n=1 Tax=Phaffia rhodozyma TaxID=264483 RepID=A0A0F7SN27_PHARH|nr:hypothetical protein [Phaffia rhodozyma]